MAAVSVKQYRSFGFQLDDLPAQVEDLIRVTATTTTATVTIDGFANVRLVLKGTGFKFDAKDNFIAGKITDARAEIKVGGKFVKAIEFSGFTVDVAKAISDPNYAPFAGMGINYDGSAFVPDASGEGVTMVGTNRADTIVGSSISDQLYGQTGNDVVKGGAGDDFIHGGGGKDKLYGDAGNDHFTGGSDAVFFSGGSGTDMVDYGNATKAVTASLKSASKNAGFAAGDTYSSIESLSGSRFSDKLYGNGGHNTLAGWGGNDTLDGGDGNDVLFGWAGADKLVGGLGSDTAAYGIVLPNGLSATTSDGKGVTADLANAGKNTGDAKGDTYSSIENLRGSEYSDKLYGDSKANILTGAAGNDTLDGRSGNDRLIGGAGADKLYGGSGSDTFVFLELSDSTTKSRDTIYKFSQSEGDKIDLSAIDASTKATGNQAFSFVATKAFSGKAGEVRYQKADGGTYVYADVNGDKKIDLSIFLDTSVTLTKADFIL